MDLKHYKIKIFTWAVFLWASLCTIAFGKQSRIAIVNGHGTTADFARAYPYMMLAAIAVMAAFIWYLLRQKDAGDAQKINEINENLRLANKKWDQANEKIDATINTLFGRDRQIEAMIAVVEKKQTELETTCRMNRELCRSRTAIISGLQKEVRQSGDRTDTNKKKPGDSNNGD